MVKREVSMTRKCQKLILQTNPRHREEETQNTNRHVTTRRQNKGNQLSLPQRDDYKAGLKDTKYCIITLNGYRFSFLMMTSCGERLFSGFVILHTIFHPTPLHTDRYGRSRGGLVGLLNRRVVRSNRTPVTAM